MFRLVSPIFFFFFSRFYKLPAHLYHEYICYRDIILKWLIHRRAGRSRELEMELSYTGHINARKELPSVVFIFYFYSVFELQYVFLMRFMFKLELEQT